MTRRGERITIAVLFAGFVLAYGANGREIGTYDSRPSELAAREFLLRGTLTLNHAVGAVPAYADRWGFILTKDNSYRAIYSPVPSLVAAAVIWPLWRTGVIDIRAPLAVQLIGKLTATILVALAAVICYTTARRVLPRAKAVLIACGLALGTGWWSVASQTLWQSETAVFGLAIAIAALMRLDERPRAGTAAALVVGLSLAGRSSLPRSGCCSSPSHIGRRAGAPPSWRAASPRRRWRWRWSTGGGTAASLARCRSSAA
jgi:hypothetical protein